MGPTVLILFVLGSMEDLGLIQANICRVFVEAKQAYSLQVIDVQEHPEAIKEYRVLAFPTLLKLDPFPVRRLVGKLTEPDLVHKGLELGSNQVVDLSVAESAI